jgi:hypothetical protein
VAVEFQEGHSEIRSTEKMKREVEVEVEVE